MSRESGFSEYLRKTMNNDSGSRARFLEEIEKSPVASRRRLLRHFRFLADPPLSPRKKSNH
jgi:hypothetical protein